MTILQELYEAAFGQAPDCLEALPAGGSDRRYYRLRANGCPSAIGTFGNDISENRAFVSLARHFASVGARVPGIYSVSPDFRAYLQTDLGNESLFSVLGTSRAPEMVGEAMDSLPLLQDMSPENAAKLSGQPDFSPRLVMWDLNYFKYCFLRQTGLNYSENLLEDDFERMARDLMDCGRLLEGFMYRDCQSRNVMVHDGSPWWIDFQGGRRGPAVYDAVSFLWQARAEFTPGFRQAMLERWLRAWSLRRVFDVPGVRRSVPLFVLLRALQVLGAYGFRGVIQKKAHFLSSIRQGMGNLADACAGLPDRYPEIARIADALVDCRPFSEPESDSGRLTVSVFSFSYKMGYPADWSGNGGGFVFDCRALPNPGRYERYKARTGRDADVRAFLEESPEVMTFVRRSSDMVVPAVERYRERGFTRLQASFGCTGGQHRSVYCAERLAREIARRFPDVKVRLEHREQGITELFNETV